LPGGWADVGDVPSNAAEREVHEEAGFECVARKVIGIFDCNRAGGEQLAVHHAVKVIFLWEIRAAGQTPTTKFWKWISSRATISHRSRCLARTRRACSNVSRIWMIHIGQRRSISPRGPKARETDWTVATRPAGIASRQEGLRAYLTRGRPTRRNSTPGRPSNSGALVHGFRWNPRFLRPWSAFDAIRGMTAPDRLR
jgi:ADP-ribose pyrophosphatase YjhB (NUDIX family)